MIKEFWNQNVNPITMFTTTTRQPTTTVADNKKSHYIGKSELVGLISSKALSMELGIGVKKIKQMYASLDEIPKYNQGNTYYKASLVPQIKEMLSSEKVVEVKKTVCKDGFISNQELIAMFGVSTYKAWEIARNERLAIHRFGSAANYYEKDKAVEAFNKYKK